MSPLRTVKTTTPTSMRWAILFQAFPTRLSTTQFWCNLHQYRSDMLYLLSFRCQTTFSVPQVEQDMSVKLPHLVVAFLKWRGRLKKGSAKQNGHPVNRRPFRRVLATLQSRRWIKTKPIPLGSSKIYCQFCAVFGSLQGSMRCTHQPLAQWR